MPRPSLRRPLATGSIAAALLCLALPGCGRVIEERTVDGSGGAGGEAPARWRAPACEPIAVLDGVPVHDTGREHRVIVALDEPNVLLAASYGLDRSNDGGCTWEVIDTEETPGFPGGYDQLVAKPGGGAYALRVNGGGDELLTVDGDVVTLLPGPPAPAGVLLLRFSHLQVDPADRDHLILASHGPKAESQRTYFRSTDGGLTWVPTERTRGRTVRGFSVHPLDFDRLILSDDEGVWTSEDGGITWAPSTLLSGGELVEHPIEGSMVRSAAAPDIVFATVSPGLDEPPPYGAPFGLYRSADGGATFEHLEEAREVPEWHPRLANPEASDDLWFANPLPGTSDTGPRGATLHHIVDGTERARVEIEGISLSVLAVSPAGTLYVARKQSAQ